MIKKFLLYAGRWQLSTPLLAGIIWLLSGMNPLVVTVIANFIGSCIFFFVDRIIFRPKPLKFPLWEIQNDVVCVDCGILGEGRRVVLSRHYDRTYAKKEFRCQSYSKIKLELGK